MRSVPAHVVIWESVNGPVPDGMEINHVDGVKSHNWISNLEPTTPSGNIRHAHATGLMNVKRGIELPQAKLDDDAVREIRTLAQTRTRQCVAEMFGVSRRTIYNIVNGKAWSHVV